MRTAGVSAAAELSPEAREFVRYFRTRMEANIELARWRRAGRPGTFEQWVTERRPTWSLDQRAALVQAMERLAERLRAMGVAV